MENIELIPANSLPVTEAEEVSVLCLDNGELKQKPGASLGGNSGGYVLTLTVEDMNATTEDGMMFTYSGSRDDFAQQLYNGGTVWLDLSELMGTCIRILVGAFGTDENGILAIMASYASMNVVVQCPNGTWMPPEN